MPFSSRTRRPAALVACCAWTLLSSSPEDARAVQTPSIIPHGSGDAVQAVDRFLAAVNRGDTDAIRDAFAPGAVAFDYALGEEHFVRQTWLDHPSEYFLLQARYAVGDDIQVVARERLAQGSFVSQTERWLVRKPDGEVFATTLLTTYKARGGRIFRVWHFPVPSGEVPPVVAPRFASAEGPEVWVDTWHGNTNTPDGLYFAFAELLRRDGYRVRVWERSFDPESLAGVEILVIPNALPPSHADGMSRPGVPVPSAFTEAEIQAVRNWVVSGGSLLLIADHDPMAGAAAALAKEFGAHFFDGAARDTARARGGPDIFTRQDGTLLDHPITDRSGRTGQVDSVRTFLGQAFEIEESLDPIIQFPSTMVVVPPGEDQNPEGWLPAEGWVQAAVGEFGAGRVALFGEAWMFRFFQEGWLDSNGRLLLNLFGWLAREL